MEEGGGLLACIVAGGMWDVLDTMGVTVPNILGVACTIIGVLAIMGVEDEAMALVYAGSGQPVRAESKEQRQYHI